MDAAGHCRSHVGAAARAFCGLTQRQRGATQGGMMSLLHSDAGAAILPELLS